MVAASVLDRMGGWRTRRPSARIWSCRSSAPWRRIQVFWVPKAVTYDEQPPLTFREVGEAAQALDQRDPPGGWALSARGRPGLAARPSGAAWDVGATLLIPAYQAAALINLAVSALAAGQMGPEGFSPLLCAAGAAGSLAIAALGATLLAALVLTVEGSGTGGWGSPGLLLAVSAQLGPPITIHRMFQKTTVWEEIRHTRNLTAVPGRGKAPAL